MFAKIPEALNAEEEKSLEYIQYVWDSSML